MIDRLIGARACYAKRPPAASITRAVADESNLTKTIQKLLSSQTSIECTQGRRGRSSSTTGQQDVKHLAGRRRFLSLLLDWTCWLKTEAHRRARRG